VIFSSPSAAVEDVGHPSPGRGCGDGFAALDGQAITDVGLSGSDIVNDVVITDGVITDALCDDPMWSSLVCSAEAVFTDAVITNAVVTDAVITSVMRPSPSKSRTAPLDGGA
jgi:hypothetical protein